MRVSGPGHVGGHLVAVAAERVHLLWVPGHVVRCVGVERVLRLAGALSAGPHLADAWKEGSVQLSEKEPTGCDSMHEQVGRKR